MEKGAEKDRTGSLNTHTQKTQNDGEGTRHVSSTSAEATVTVVAGNGIRSSIGDLVVTVPASSEYIVGPLDSMRFKDLTTGNITVKISGGTTKIKPFSL